jgi:hypothetical protein
MEILIGLVLVVVLMILMGKAFQKDLNEIEKTNTEYRNNLKEKYGL